ncbi:PREDICTED: shematrin-like protein 2 isoform X1 [Dinoponera quadriceps]|uniref:Shematrin-like protein 2 isoform X1 n=1 Tax=Dinoponera quadriceps TaxID=609295 RepID=A0A6P3Y1P4_DINQU|nr:PREDICTED: shematrin-like protein 2 isoform X1 [Dinoponera quadriceps]
MCNAERKKKTRSLRQNGKVKIRWRETKTRRRKVRYLCYRDGEHFVRALGCVRTRLGRLKTTGNLLREAFCSRSRIFARSLGNGKFDYTDGMVFSARSLFRSSGSCRYGRPYYGGWGYGRYPGYYGGWGGRYYGGRGYWGGRGWGGYGGYWG